MKKLLFIGSSCIYPRNSKQPMKEEYLLDGKLEPTNEAYAIAKITGIKMCQYYNRQYNTNFVSVMPSNVYGISDNFNLKNSHVLAALIRRFHEAKIHNKSNINIWGTGKAKREFLIVDDLAEALLFVMQNYNESEFLNIGTGKVLKSNDLRISKSTPSTSNEISSGTFPSKYFSINELAELIRKIVGFKGKLVFDTTKPDGMPRKLLDVSKINNLGWKAQISLEDGIEKTYKWFLNNA